MITVPPSAKEHFVESSKIFSLKFSKGFHLSVTHYLHAHTHRFSRDNAPVSKDFDPHTVTGPMFLHEVGGNIGTCVTHYLLLWCIV